MAPITLYPGGDQPVTPNLKLALNNMSLTSGNNFEILDAAFGSGGSPGGSTGQVQGNKAGVFGGLPGSTIDFTNGLLTLAPTGTGVALTISNGANGAIQINNPSAANGGPATLAIGTPLANPDSPGILLTGSQVGVGNQFSNAIEIHGAYANGVNIYVHSDTSFRAPATTYYRSRGTQLSPTTVLSGDILAYPNQIYAYDGTSYQPGGTLEPRATQTWGATSHGCAWDIFVVANNTTNQFRAIQVDNTGFVGIGVNAVGPPALLSVGATSQFQITGTGNTTAPTITLTAAAPVVAAARVGFGSTTAATATAGGGQAAPATTLGYLIANVAGTLVKIPYYSA